MNRYIELFLIREALLIKYQLLPSLTNTDQNIFLSQKIYEIYFIVEIFFFFFKLFYLYRRKKNLIKEEGVKKGGGGGGVKRIWRKMFLEYGIFVDLNLIICNY